MLTKRDKVKDAVIKVGKGRGFIIEAGNDRLIITCGHCLGPLPISHGASRLGERTYRRLLGGIGKRPNVWAECAFVDPIADVALLREPDPQDLSRENDGYKKLTAELPTIKVRAGKKDEPVWVLSLHREWRKGLLAYVSATHLSIDIDEKFIQRGMSGSPVLNANACAVGVVALGAHAFSPALPGVLPVSQWNKMKPSRKKLRVDNVR